VVDGFTQTQFPVWDFRADRSNVHDACSNSSKFSLLDYEDIGEVHKHRYLCQLIALEIFSA
jgi:hypothetical protein